MTEEKRKSTALQMLSKHLSAHGLRMSSERGALLDKALQLKTFNAANIEEAMKDDGFRVSRATIYNNLHLFEDAGIVARADGIWELVVDNSVTMTLLCDNCGRRRQIKNTALFRELASRRFTAFTATNINITVHGKCRRCRKK